MPEYPSTIWIEPTNRCNTRCRTCPHFHADYGQDMPEDIFGRIREQVLPHVSRVNLVGGGEPLAAAHFDRLMDTCLESGARVFFITNGKALTPERIEKCVRAGAEVMVSLDGVSPETYNFIRPFIDFSRLRATIASVAGIRARHPDSAFKLFTNTVVMGRNIAELPEIVAFCLDQGVDSISFSDFAPAGVAAFDAAFAAEIPSKYPDELGRAFAKASRLAEAAGARIACPPYYHALAATSVPTSGPARPVPAPEVADKRFIFAQRCHLPHTHANFLADGRVLACCVGSMELGDIGREDFGAIWNGDRYRWLRALIHTNNPPAQCKYCNTHAGVNAGDPDFFNRFLARNTLRDLAPDHPDIEASGAFAWRDGESGRELVVMGDVELSLPLGGADFVGLSIVPDGGLCRGMIAVDGESPTPFDSSDATVLALAPDAGWDRASLRLAVRPAGEGGSGELVVRGVRLLRHDFRAEKGLVARHETVRHEHGRFLAGLEAAFAAWAAGRGDGEKNFGVFGLIDAGELFVEDVRPTGAKFKGYFDHFAGHVRQRRIKPLASMRLAGLDALVLVSPYRREAAVRLLGPICEAQGVALLFLP